jgi:hypothetical protein
MYNSKFEIIETGTANAVTEPTDGGLTDLAGGRQFGNAQGRDRMLVSQNEICHLGFGFRQIIIASNNNAENILMALRLRQGGDPPYARSEMTA